MKHPLRLRSLRATLAAVAATAALAGCAASPFNARVTTFQQWPADAVGATYRFAADSRQESLEQRSYEDVIRSSLGSVGLVEAQPGSRPARFTVGFTYRTEPFQTYAETPAPFPPPFYGYGYYGRGPWGWGMGFPFGGYPAYQAVPVTAYRNILEVSIRDASRGGQEVFQGRAMHAGGPDSMVDAMPYLAQAVFADFPYGNGQTRTVQVPRRQ
ncbi:DUF4136 domain-containing protein [Achromobacter sp. GG226]|uniref:DUF4136 domain-containing protein n=1 Tax=Verticiella alkaliphila TaxID=2779529 RepID=UPI001C0C1EF7|nr:DUF4136 domain-containing protein [Verticiella sp. GG226]MBU4610269.1 DUF4136 domain-containing protein [Verticiella sp. GG226]